VNYKLSVGSFGVTFDQFVLTERTLRPFNDISLASVAGINWKKIIDAGIGVEFAHLLPVDSRYTSPVLSGTRYPTGTGDSGTYTFKGTKVMARATIDPFALKRGRNSFLTALLGENGGKMYGEWAVIGLESYPATNPVSALGNPYGYDKIKEKMPWMVGINIPLWKLLDVCAFEIEKYPAPYPNDYENVVRGTVEPLPVLPAAGTEYDSASYRIDRWYWSLYMKRQIVKHFNVIGQIAHDHVKWDMPAGNVENYDFEDILVKPGQWAWRIVGSLEF
jgi:hypothetical protein